MYKTIAIAILLASLSYNSVNAQAPGNTISPIHFKTSDSRLQTLYDSAAEKAKWNITQFGMYKVLVEGAGYSAVWLETQPMGGYMYGKRDPEIARNNIEIFIDYQRSISALENYGHFAELTMLGQVFLTNLEKYNKFTQQYDPFTGAPNNSSDGYGPTILTTMELVTRMFGIHFAEDKIYCSCLDSPGGYEYSQVYSNIQYQLKTNSNMVECFVNGRKKIAFSKGIRVITGLDGQLTGVAGIDTSEKKATIIFNGKSYPVNVSPNTVFSFDGKIKQAKKVPFCQPFN
jgi:hypothetical protein